MSRKYTEEFKREVLSLRNSGRSVNDLCRTHGLGKNTVSQWMNLFDSSGQVRSK